MADNQDKVIQPGGLHTDSSLVNQPPGTTRFNLNIVNESAEGDKTFRSIENSNEPCYQLPTGYVPVGKVYIGNEDNLLFLAHPNGNSIIGIVDKANMFTIKVDDSAQAAKLGFKITHQIDAQFRLRRGCERTTYFVTPKPMIFNIDKPQDFIDETTGFWDIDKFNLFKSYSSIPIIQDLEAIDGAGSLLPGSYNFSIQYLDEDLNPTEFITSTDTVKIYNSNLGLPFRDIRGSTSVVKSYQDFGKTDKAIRIQLSNLDTSYPFYRIAITEANNGSGDISGTKYTSEISTQNTIFTYTGNNYQVLGSQEEIVINGTIIDSADHILQIDNILLLGNVKGKQLNYCNLQQYASRITADMVTKQIILNQISPGNPKNPTADFEAVGYMPGEIYSFGIVYIFDDNSLSPVYHIPGKNPTVNPTTMYSTGANVYPMSQDNLSTDNRYIDNESCGDNGYWGLDSEGDSLEGELVRHHRFPLRTDYNIPMITKASESEVSSLFKRLSLIATGSMEVAVVCPDEGDPDYDPACITPNPPPPFTVEVFYTVDGNPGSFSFIIDPSDWASDSSPADITFNTLSDLISGTNVVVTSVEEDGVVVPGSLSGTSYDTSESDKGLVYRLNLIDALTQFNEDTYVGSIFGIKFSNILLPSEADTNGNKIIGYYIVRNERIEDEKTILDSAVLTSTVKNKNFVSAGLLMPQFTDDSLIKKDIVNMINPEFKFNNKKYTNFTKIIQQGKFTKQEAIYSRTKINDVLDGTSYVSGKHKRGESDPDGWSIQIKTRDNLTAFSNLKNFEIDAVNIKETFYLDALADKFILDSAGASADVYNLACDNKTGIMSFDQNITFPIMNSVPYVYLYKDNANPYYNFRLTPYYKDSKNPHYFDNTGISTVEIFSGDSYITPIRYVNSIFYDNRIKKRKGKTSVLNIIVGAILIVAAVAITVFSLGAGTAAGVLLASAAPALISGGALLIASGIKQDAWNKAYNQLYNEGLRDTIADDYLKFDADPNNGHQRGFSKNPSDDEVQWLGDCLNLWFESAVNMDLRYGCTDNTPDFVNAPGSGELGSTYPEYDREYFGIHSVGSGSKEDVPPTTSLDNHMLKKLTYIDSERKSGRAYVGLALAELYQINPDYIRKNKQKIFNHLGLEYDCCSECIETFPHRWHWSEQSFQEELTDNFRLFLPNNYKDLEGNTGPITDMFRIQNNLYIHTEDSLWHMPQNIQERVTQDIISFIGTGEYFNIAPRKIVDDENSSAGTIHKWGRLKTKYGVLFPSYKEKKWYVFNGEKLKPITDAGMSNHFRTDMQFLLDDAYFASNHKPYLYNNNPSNPIGIGYVSAYDSTKERLIITKKDFKPVVPFPADYEICTDGNTVVAFENYSQIIQDKEANGYTYLGIENCRMKFAKTVYTTQTVTQQIIVTTPNDTDVYAFYDTSGSFDGGQLAAIRASVIAWYTDFRPSDTTFAHLHHINDASERWLKFPDIIPSGQDVLVMTFVNEANPIYHGAALETSLAAPTATYIADYNAFVNTVYPGLNSFIGINYPIVTGNVASSTGVCFLQHSLAAVKGEDYTFTEVNELEPNSAYTPAEWSTIKSSLMSNPYDTLVDGVGDPGLEKYNWRVKSNKNDLGTLATDECEASDEIISPCQFASDINALLADFTEVVESEVDIQVPETEYLFVDGEEIDLARYNTGWTMSYSLEEERWISWHSYIPSFYITMQERHYSWLPNAGNYIWRHNRPNHYLTFYGIYHPMIVEYVDNNNPLVTQITDGIMFQTEAKRFDVGTQEFYDLPTVTFSKLIAYNTHQTTGLQSLVVKNNASTNYLANQTVNANTVVIIDRNERDWTLNSLRNYRVGATPMFIKEYGQLQSQYYIDKIVNPASINFNKDWSQVESLRDKFLVVRLIFDTFEDVKLVMNFGIEDKKVSER